MGELQQVGKLAINMLSEISSLFSKEGASELGAQVVTVVIRGETVCLDWGKQTLCFAGCVYEHTLYEPAPARWNHYS